MSIPTITHTIRAVLGPTTVQAQPATPGLYVYEIPAEVDILAPCRWRLGHHSGLLLASFRTAEEAHKGAAAIADWTDWTGQHDALRAEHLHNNRDQDALDDLVKRIEDTGGHIDGCAYYDDCR